MNKGKGSLPFADMAKKGVKDPKADKVKHTIIGSIDPKLAAISKQKTIQGEEPQTPAPKRTPSRPRRKKILNGRPVGKQIYFDEEVLEELRRRNEEGGLNVSFFVNKLVKDKLGL